MSHVEKYNLISTQGGFSSLSSWDEMQSRLQELASVSGLCVEINSPKTSCTDEESDAKTGNLQRKKHLQCRDTEI